MIRLTTKQKLSVVRQLIIDGELSMFNIARGPKEYWKDGEVISANQNGELVQLNWIHDKDPDPSK